ncbi:GTPase Era, mitochondrial-like, partial [Plectropomus leopardus]|uniref:GTPase Era, mitochondrial-like n=1 Tax=Plectropomus leopardus TaxID=160734 RepID=UPI001C4DC2CE
MSEFETSERNESLTWQRRDGRVDVFTGNAACSQGGRAGFIFTPAVFITSEAFLSRLMKGRAAAAEADGGFYRLPASVPTDSGGQMSLLLRDPDQPKNPKLLKVAIIGAPNAGKSTLTNQLLGRKVVKCPPYQQGSHGHKTSKKSDFPSLGKS